MKRHYSHFLFWVGKKTKPRKHYYFRKFVIATGCNLGGRSCKNSAPTGLKTTRRENKKNCVLKSAFHSWQAQTI